MPVAKIWNGSAWVTPNGWSRPRIWNGSAWVPSNPRIWDGSNWGENLTTGSTATIVFGGKGTAGYSLFSHGFSPGSATFGNYEDYDNFYSIGYAPIGSFEGQIAAGGSVTVSELIWHNFDSDDSEFGYFEDKLVIKIAANIAGPVRIPYIDGTAIAGAKGGTWDGTYTTFTWINGTRPNSGGAEIPGSDASTPSANPFGADGTKHTFTFPLSAI
jgi:hypothetical protein